MSEAPGIADSERGMGRWVHKKREQVQNYIYIFLVFSRHLHVLFSRPFCCTVQNLSYLLIAVLLECVCSTCSTYRMCCPLL